MKRIALVLLSVLMILSVFAGCSKKEGDKKESSLLMPTKLDTMEYTLYQNIFYNNQMDEYAGKDAIKQGTFATLFDAYNGVTRYYIWGYNDNTKCCDWQWELKIEDDKNLPVNGSLVEVEGKYEKNDKALDGLWIVNPKISVKTKYKGNDYDVDMLSMSNTLERVQISNVLSKPEQFEGKTIGFYGRIKSADEIEDAYYDNSWSVKINGDFELSAFGTKVVANGKVKNGEITETVIGKNTQY